MWSYSRHNIDYSKLPVREGCTVKPGAGIKKRIGLHVFQDGIDVMNSRVQKLIGIDF